MRSDRSGRQRGATENPRLLLFDIDGTLIISSLAGKSVMVYALERVFGTSGPIESYSLAGKTDLEAIWELMTAAGIPAWEIEGNLAAVYRLMAEEGRTVFRGNGLSPCPGVPVLLVALGHRDDVLLGLITGNIQDTARLKLEAAGIDSRMFAVGAFGSDAADRNRLPQHAWRRAEKLTDHRFGGSNTVIIGDTPQDITCAQENGATSVAVASGRHNEYSLSKLGPDHLLSDLTNTEKVLEILLRKE